MNKHLRVLLMHTIALSVLSPCALATLPLSAHPTRPSLEQQEEVLLKQLFRQTEVKFGVSIAYKSELVKDQKAKIDLATCKSPEEVLDKVLAPFNLSYQKVRE